MNSCKLWLKAQFALWKEAGSRRFSRRIWSPIMDDRPYFWKARWIWHDQEQDYVWMSGKSACRLYERKKQHERQQRQEQEAGQDLPFPTRWVSRFISISSLVLKLKGPFQLAQLSLAKQR